MIYQDKIRDLVDEYASLSLAIDKLLEKQEKSWGCFQVTKEDKFSALYVPALPSFKLYQNPKSIIYRGYWRRNNELPNPTDTKAFPPDLWIAKKQQKVAVSKNTGSVRSQKRKKEGAKKQIIYQPTSSATKKKINTITETVQKKQRIYEITYRYNPTLEIRIINQLIANFIKEKITASIVSVPEEEIFPLVLVGTPQ